MSPESPQGSNVPRLASLLTTGESAVWRDDDLGALLRHQLATTVPEEASTFDEVLTKGRGGMESMERIKEFAKAARDEASSGMPPAVCHVLYYSAIAVARTRYGNRITSLDDSSLVRGLKWAVSVHWIDESLRAVIRDAVQFLGAVE